MREVTNVTENQIVLVPPGLNIFKNSDTFRDIKLAADMQDEEEEVKMPVKEPVEKSASFYGKLVEEQIAEEDQDVLFGKEADSRGVTNRVSPLQQSLNNMRGAYFQTGSDAQVG
jgi:hypothetical protein